MSGGVLSCHRPADRVSVICQILKGPDYVVKQLEIQL